MATASAKKKTTRRKSGASTSKKNNRTRSYAQMIEMSPTPVILADEDFNITYMNPISLETLKKVEEHLPCRAEEIVGKNIDFFHKNPAHQRGILSRPQDLPVRADIELGPEKLDLLVSASHDSDGTVMGPLVTWEPVTEKRKDEVESA